MPSVYTDDGTLKRLAGKGWRNSVMQRRIYGRWGLVRRRTHTNQVNMLLRLTKSAKKEAEDWARQTKRTLGNENVYLIIGKCNIVTNTSLVMEMIKQRKHTWISRPKRQRSTEQPVMPVEDNGGLYHDDDGNIYNT